MPWATSAVRYHVSEVFADVNLYIVIIRVGKESLGAFIHHGVTDDRSDIAPNTY